MPLIFVLRKCAKPIFGGLIAASLIASTTSGWAATKDDTAKNVPTPVAATMGSSTLTYTNTKTGKPICRLNIQTGEAQTGALAGSATAILHNVSGLLYQNGVPADHVTAPTMTVDQSKQVVIATGGVKVVSVTKAATSVRCDKLVWHANNNQLIGTGHVIFRSGGLVQTSNSFQADTKLKTVQIPAGGPMRHGVGFEIPAPARKPHPKH